MDPGCTMCPLGAGVDPAAIAYFNQYPKSNGFVSGDGLNTASFTWSAPNPTVLNTYIAKFDYAFRKHRLFVRGNLQGDKTSGPPRFPGDPPSYLLTNDTKGLAVDDSWTITTNLINRSEERR